MGRGDSVEIFILDPMDTLSRSMFSFSHCIHIVLITATILQMKT